MSKAIRLFVIAVIGCTLQTNVAHFLKIGGVAPDFMIAMCVALAAFTSASGSFCTSALMIMFYDASVGFVLALNPIAYPLIALAASSLRKRLSDKLAKLRHKSVLVAMLVCFFLALCREFAYVGYLYLIGSEFNSMVGVRMLLCSGYTALMTIPCIYLIRWLMNCHPIKKTLIDRIKKFFRH